MPHRLLELLPRFGLEPGRPAPEHALPGSPQRCIERFALADASGRLWMLERIRPEAAPRRERLGALLSALAREPGLGALIPAYLPVVGHGQEEGQGDGCEGGSGRSASRSIGTPSGGQGGRLPGLERFVLRLPGEDLAGESLAGCWMLSPFVSGHALPQPGYLDHGWRGAALAGGILAVQRAGAALPALPLAPQPCLPAFRDDFFRKILLHAPTLAPRLAAVQKALDALEQAVDAVPAALAHGDLHPLNVIWGREGHRPLHGLIDWEFAGARPRLYDAANALGCAGFEHPSGLSRRFALDFVRGLRQGGIPAPELRRLPPFVLFTRLGWLSEWLRAKDAGLLALELDYLDILLAEREALAGLWSGGA